MGQSKEVLRARMRVAESNPLVEVEWYFQLAETEMSEPSNYGRVLASIGQDGDRRTAEDQAEAAHAYRRIRAWLRAVPNRDAGVLQAAYELRDWPRIVRARFGSVTGVAVRLTCAPDEWPEDRRLQVLMEKVRAEELADRCARPDTETPFLDRLQARADAKMQSAQIAYFRVRGAGPSVLPLRAWRARLS